jgi:2-haloacid dehalogenase
VPAYRPRSKEIQSPPSHQSTDAGSNVWNAHAVKTFGYRVIWINRFRQAKERLPGEPDAEVPDLGAVPDLLAPI